MAKTALDLTEDEWRAYDPGAAVRRRQATVDPQVERRWQQAQQLARDAAQRLRDQFGARRVLLFGSAAERSSFTRWSDVDLAAWGIPPERFYAAVAAVTSFRVDIPVDLVDAEQCSEDLKKIIAQEGVEL
ncbi:MAG: nucleotidyltransferase domain-containing protein [Planctomycetes bacterium]|jgi:predicted nucleotidyltransferase|nr:nucleotidyltransferase domain-containing protein [Planctomycetota bacterium]